VSCALTKTIASCLWFSFHLVDDGSGVSLASDALRLRELGMIKSSPQKIIAQGTDWRFLNAIRKELKG